MLNKQVPFVDNELIVKTLGVKQSQFESIYNLFFDDIKVTSQIEAKVKCAIARAIRAERDHAYTMKESLIIDRSTSKKVVHEVMQMMLDEREQEENPFGIG